MDITDNAVPCWTELCKAAFTLSGKSELYRHKPASNIFDAVRYRSLLPLSVNAA